MLSLFTSDKKSLRILYTVLLSIAGALIVLLITGTIYGLARSSDEPLFRLGRSGTMNSAAGDTSGRETYTAITQTYDDVRVFSGLERLRIPLSNSSILILSIAFPYSAGDIAFTEELAGKINEFRVIANDYFSSLPADKIIQIDEEAAKTEILTRYNSILRLGRINTLYFSDLMIIDAGS